MLCGGLAGVNVRGVGIQQEEDPQSDKLFTYASLSKLSSTRWAGSRSLSGVSLR
jgi:hypothetical protein